MNQTKSLLDSLWGGAQGLAAGPCVQGGATQARNFLDGRSPMARGAVAGGLLGVLLTGNARRRAEAGVTVGGVALIGGLACKAYADWQAAQSGAAAPAVAEADFEVDDDVAERLLQAMVAAARADGHVTPAECIRIEARLSRMGLAAETQALIAAELASPPDVGRIAGLARSEAEAVEIYTASLLVVDPDGAAEKGYLAMLAARLGLEPALVARVHAQAGL